MHISYVEDQDVNGITVNEPLQLYAYMQSISMHVLCVFNWRLANTTAKGMDICK